jgi:cytochrome c551/c552
MSPLRVTAAGLLLLVAGCGGADTQLPANTTVAVEATLRPIETRGEELFEERVVGVNPGCVTCHSLEEGVTLVGPSLSEVSSRVAGMSDADYVRQSIIEPDAYVVEGFSPGQMSPDWGRILSEEQIDSLVDFLLSR